MSCRTRELRAIVHGLDATATKLDQLKPMIRETDTKYEHAVTEMQAVRAEMTMLQKKTEVLQNIIRDNVAQTTDLDMRTARLEQLVRGPTNQEETEPDH